MRENSVVGKEAGRESSPLSFLVPQTLDNSVTSVRYRDIGGCSLQLSGQNDCDVSLLCLQALFA